MQFKYPEFLYALILLVIPVLIHLFQLRRFKKVAFTNVAFLKKYYIFTSNHLLSSGVSERTPSIYPSNQLFSTLVKIKIAVVVCVLREIPLDRRK